MQSFDSDRHKDEDALPHGSAGAARSYEPADPYGLDGEVEPLQLSEEFDLDADTRSPSQAYGSMDPYEASAHGHAEGNRPAEQARVTSPGEAFLDDWTGGEGAGDFLELESTLGHVSDDGTALALETEVETEEYAGNDLQLTEDVPKGTLPGEHLFRNREERVGGALSDGDGEFDEDYDGEFELDGELEEAGSRGFITPLRLVLVGFGIGLVAMVGSTLMDDSGGTDPVSVSTGGATSGNRPAPAAATGIDTAGTDPVASVDPASLSGALDPGTGSGGESPTNFSEPLSVEPEVLMAQFPAMMLAASVFMTPIAPVSTIKDRPDLQPFLPSPPVAATAAGNPLGNTPGLGSVGATSGDPRVGGAGSLPPGALAHGGSGNPVATQLPTFGGGGDVESLASMAALLQDTTIMYNLNTVPVERVNGPVQIKTPAVGNVRVALERGDLFEGRLYAVGQGYIWLDTELGRMGLDASTVLSIDRLVTNATPGVLAVDPNKIGSRVRARTEAGYFIMGRVAKINGDDVTLLTDNGARITMKASEVQALGSHPKVRLDL